MDKNHKHFILNSVVKNPINDEDSCKKWLTDLVEVINMDILVPAIAKYCDIPGNEGITGAIIITTSHISIHVWPIGDKPYIRMDVYSCKDFSVKKVLEFVNKTIGMVDYDYVLIDRNKTKMNIIS